ncbi:MAG: PIN domain nuclease [Anaerolineae bacterium]|nr:PIN domain nuclease [Anaerolineae bacterium]
MSSELALRLLGMVALALAGARFGVEIAVPPVSAEVFALIFGLVGALAGLILTPYVTTRPARVARRVIREMSAEVLLTSIIGLIIGLIVGALFAVPLGLLPQPFSQWVPAIVAIVAAYLMINIFAFRAQDVFRLTQELFRGGGESSVAQPIQTDIHTLLDTSVIIDGRILDISKTGFLFGTLLVPRFVLAELQHIADSGDAMRRNRGRRGLEILEELQRDSKVPVTVIDADVDGVREVDAKLVVLAKQMNAPLMTNDWNLNRVAELQGVRVLNINDLANAVKAVFLPNDVITITIIQEGREPNQGVGYLEDGTMVVVEEGKRYMDRTIDVIVTRMIQTAAGKMYFARPADDPRK